VGLGHSPRIVTDGLVLALDGANYKSFKGVPATNILNQIGYTNSNTDTSLFKYTQGAENVYIPSLGYVNSKYVDIYNDYSGGSGNCCPTLFSYGGSLAVSSSTTYTYSIIYKTTTGYSHPNYMYRYEYNGGTYVTEGGVHSTSNRTSLGDGWWFAWGQFTTQSTTTSLTARLFHYEYATYNRIYVYKAALYAGTYVIPPEHMLDSSEDRGSTVATGGGWKDLVGSNNGTLTNGPTYSSDNGGSLVFDGSNDYVSISDSSSLNMTSQLTLSVFAHLEDWSITNSGKILSKTENGAYQLFHNHPSVGGSGYIGALVYYGGAYRNVIYSSSNLSSGWHCICATVDGRYLRLYVDGFQVTTYDLGSTGVITTTSSHLVLGAEPGTGTTVTGDYFPGSISNALVYNKALSAEEVKQNFNAIRGRFGI